MAKQSTYKDPPQKSRGVVLWFRSRYGYGFIKDEQLHFGKEIFVHYSNIITKDREGWKFVVTGEECEYHVAPGRRPNTLQAINVRVLNPRLDRKPLENDGLPIIEERE